MEQCTPEPDQQDLIGGPVLFMAERITADLERLALLAGRDGAFVFVTWEGRASYWVQVGINERTHDTQVNLPALDHDARAFLDIAAPYAGRLFALTFVSGRYMELAFRCDLTSGHDRQQLAQDVLALAERVEALRPGMEVAWACSRG